MDAAPDARHDGGNRVIDDLPASDRAAAIAVAINHGALLQSYRAQQTIACNFAHTLVERCARISRIASDITF